jgi:hypothetical protein
MGEDESWEDAPDHGTNKVRIRPSEIHKKRLPTAAAKKQRCKAQWPAEVRATRPAETSKKVASKSFELDFRGAKAMGEEQDK